MRAVLILLVSLAAVPALARSSAARLATREPRAEAGGQTLDDCFRAALARSEVVATQGELIRQAEENYNQVIGSVVPNVSAVGSYQFLNTTPTNGNLVSIFPNPSTASRITATQPLFQGFKEFAGLRQAKSLIQASTWDRRKAAAQLYIDTATSFYSVVSYEHDIDNLNDELGYYDRRIEELRQFRAIGRSRLSEGLTAESQQAGFRAQLKLLQGQLRAQRAVLAFLTGFPPDTKVVRPGAGDLKSDALDAYLAHIDSRPDVLAESARVKASEEGIPIARAGHFPTLGLTGDYYIERTGALADTHWDVILAVTVPIFSGGVVNAQVSQAVSKRDQEELELSRVKRAARQEISQYYELYRGDKDQLEAYDQALTLSERNYKEELREYRNGLVTNLDVLQALTTFQESKRSLDRSRYAALGDLAHLEAAAAMKPGEGQSSAAMKPDERGAK